VGETAQVRAAMRIDGRDPLRLVAQNAGRLSGRVAHVTIPAAGRVIAAAEEVELSGNWSLHETKIDLPPASK
jgi:hypothetical protein